MRRMLKSTFVTLTAVAALFAVQPLANAIPADTTKTAIIGDSLTRGYGVNVNEAYA